MFGFLRRRRHELLLERPIPEAWQKIIHSNVPYASRLTEEDRKRLYGLVQIFLDQVRFEGCAGLEITDEIRVTIAAQACVLLLHCDHDEYRDLEVVLVYPGAYRARSTRKEGGIVVTDGEVRLGESWSRGEVILSWDHVKRGASNAFDGQNVVFHEFAHQLDAESGDVDGAPKLSSVAQYDSWARVMGSEYNELVTRIRDGAFVDIDAYAATNPPEFFAVATEMFFEKSQAMKRRHPDLYDALSNYYGQDPAERPASATCANVRGIRPRT